MVDIAKYTIGRHRPHFMDACRPNKGYTTVVLMFTNVFLNFSAQIQMSTFLIGHVQIITQRLLTKPNFHSIPDTPPSVSMVLGTHR